MAIHITVHAPKPQVERNPIFTTMNSIILIHSKRWYAYDGKHGILNVVFSDKYHSMFSHVWPPDQRMDLPLTRKQRAELNRIEF
jgi:hypothetical protein